MPPTMATRRIEEPTSMAAPLRSMRETQACQPRRPMHSGASPYSWRDARESVRLCGRDPNATPSTSDDDMTRRARLVADARTIAALGGPLLGNNLSITGMAFADTVMAGQLGAVDLGGLAIGAGVLSPVPVRRLRLADGDVAVGRARLRRRRHAQGHALRAPVVVARARAWRCCLFTGCGRWMVPAGDRHLAGYPARRDRLRARHELGHAGHCWRSCPCATPAKGSAAPSPSCTSAFWA